MQTKKAISLLGVFIGEEAARVALKEQTQTSKYARELADTFDQLDKKERVKAIAKLAISIAVRIIGVSKVAQVAKPVVQNMAVAAPVVSAARYPLRSAAKSQQATAISANKVSRQHVDKLSTLLGAAAPKRGAQPALKLDPPAAKSIAPQYALRSKDYISVNDVNRPIKATFIEEFNYHQSPKIYIKPAATETFLGATYKSYILDQDITFLRVRRGWQSH